jgi:phosphotriesterase-related protein
MTATVMTVRGAVPADELGFTLPHEHVLIDLVRAFPTQLLAFDFQLLDEELQIEEVRAFAEAAMTWGGRPTVVDVTTDRRMGRNPQGLRRIAEALDVNIVMGCGRYREPWFEPEFARTSTAALAEQLIHEIEHGADDTGIRPGIIGELGADHEIVTPAEERVLRAAGRAHAKTGLAITLHARYGRVGLDQLAILGEEGVAPGRVIVGHSDTHPDPEYQEAIAKRGAWVQFDTIRGRFPVVVERRVRYLLEARRHGYLDRLLLSHDVCAGAHLRAFGGTGYDFLPTAFAERLRQEGFSDEQLHQLFVLNPRRALTPAT